MIERHGGKVTWTANAGDKYLVTGVDTRGKRFRLCFDEWRQAKCINLFRGSRWLLRAGRRYLIQSVSN